MVIHAYNYHRLVYTSAVCAVMHLEWCKYVIFIYGIQVNMARGINASMVLSHADDVIYKLKQ